MSREIPTSPQSSQASPLTANDPREIGPYALSGRLGHGGMGVVYLGADADGSLAAVKAILPELTSDPGFRARFEREIEAAKKVRSRFTADVLAADADADQPWMASEYVADPPLSQLVGAGRRLSEVDVRQLVAGVAEALAAVHAVGLVHRDIKPGNILYGTTDPCLIDLGIARSVDGTALTQAGKAVGTYGYQAPEQVQTGTFSSAVDIWALGLVAFVAATGRWPFNGEVGSMGHLLTGESPNLSFCPDYLRPLVAACLADAPTGRPSAADILATNGDWTLLPAPVTAEQETSVGSLPPAGLQGAIARAPHAAAAPAETADLPTLAPTDAEASSPSGTSRPSWRRWRIAVVAAAAVVLVSTGVAVAASQDLLPGQHPTPGVAEVTPTAEPSTDENSPAPTAPVGGTVDTGPDTDFDEQPDDQGTDDATESVPSDEASSGDASTTAPPSTSAPASSDPATETPTPTPTPEPTETATVEPTEDPAGEPTATATP